MGLSGFYSGSPGARGFAFLDRAPTASPLAAGTALAGAGLFRLHPAAGFLGRRAGRQVFSSSRICRSSRRAMILLPMACRAFHRFASFFVPLIGFRKA